MSGVWRWSTLNNQSLIERPSCDTVVTPAVVTHRYCDLMLRVLRFAMILSFVIVIALMIASLFHVAWYEPATAPGTNRRCVIVRAFTLQAWNGGAYYRPGWTVNGNGTTYLQLWPPKGEFLEIWSMSTGATMWRVHLPLWMPLIVTAVPAAFAIRGEVRRRRAIRRSSCRKCGYSRAGLEPGAACPECGVGNSMRV